MDPMLISLVTAAIGVAVGYLAPKIAKRTRTTLDDKVVAYVQAHLPEIIEYVKEKLEKGEDPVAVSPAARPERPRVRDQRDGK